MKNLYLNYIFEKFASGIFFVSYDLAGKEPMVIWKCTDINHSAADPTQRHIKCILVIDTCVSLILTSALRNFQSLRRESWYM